MNIDGQWIYGGDRYPYQEPESHPPENGSHIICPIIWEGDHPIVKWEKEWDIAAYGGRQSKRMTLGSFSISTERHTNKEQTTCI